jgi:YggT family protein
MYILVIVIPRIIQLFILVVIVQAVLSFFMDPYHPVRRTLDRFVNPFLAPIRRFVPPVSGMDFSPVILIVLLQLLSAILTRLLLSFV